MRVRLSDIREQPFTWSDRVRLDAATLEDPRLAGLGEVSWAGELSFAAPEFLLRASLDYSRQLVCDRCLELFDDEVHEQIALLVKPGSNGGADELELGRADLDTFEVEGDDVDLGPLLAEQIVLGIPHRPLCGRAECAVPTAPIDTNAGDPRWAALESIKERLGRDRG